MNSVPYFGTITNDSSALGDKIDTLLTWAVTPLQFGDHRPYAVVTLLRLWRNKSEERAARRDTDSPNETLQDYLFDWLDESECAGDEGNQKNIAILFGKLIRDDLFEYPKYIQRLVARGERGLSYTEVYTDIYNLRERADIFLLIGF